MLCREEPPTRSLPARLSCCHVIGRYGDAQPGERVLMPSYREAEALDELAQAPIGRLTTIAALGFAVEDAPNNVDAATFEPDDSAELDAKIALVVVRPRRFETPCRSGWRCGRWGTRAKSPMARSKRYTCWSASSFPTAQGDREVLVCRADWHLSVREGGRFWVACHRWQRQGDRDAPGQLQQSFYL